MRTSTNAPTIRKPNAIRPRMHASYATFLNLLDSMP